MSKEELEYEQFCNEKLRERITNLEYKIKRLEEEIIDLRADYGTKAQIERDLAVDKIEELEKYIEELKEEIKIKNRTICHQSIIIMNANEYLENYSNEDFDFDKLSNILKGEDNE